MRDQNRDEWSQPTDEHSSPAVTNLLGFYVFQQFLIRHWADELELRRGQFLLQGRASIMPLASLSRRQQHLCTPPQPQSTGLVPSLHGQWYAPKAFPSPGGCSSYVTSLASLHGAFCSQPATKQPHAHSKATGYLHTFPNNKLRWGITAAEEPGNVRNLHIHLPHHVPQVKNKLFC